MLRNRSKYSQGHLPAQREKRSAGLKPSSFSAASSSGVLNVSGVYGTSLAVWETNTDAGELNVDS